ncbi:hypothetical protein ACIGO6_36485 [Streptomyces sp. NPDC053750]|uniref:hypothetical protein n=1 Tax=Streptomyces sp. NPDC053750 TaxID=3365714 RepID=UPI0037D8F76C
MSCSSTVPRQALGQRPVDEGVAGVAGSAGVVAVDGTVQLEFARWSAGPSSSWAASRPTPSFAACPSRPPKGFSPDLGATAAEMTWKAGIDVLSSVPPRQGYSFYHDRWASGFVRLVTSFAHTRDDIHPAGCCSRPGRTAAVRPTMPGATLTTCDWALQLAT